MLNLWATSQSAGYPSERWASYRQWSATGAQVRRGEKGTLIIYFGERRVRADAGEDDQDRRWFARGSVVFNAAQVDGAPR